MSRDEQRERGQLDRIESLLILLLRKVSNVNQQVADIISSLNANTNAVSTRLDALIAEVGSNITPDQVASLQAVSDHLKALGADPTNPVPAAPAAATTAPAPSA